MIRIDGSHGEGGGQILRTSVALSCITGEDLEVYNIRAKRPNPGLKRQHLTAIHAAAKICKASVEGAEVGSRRIVFRPSSISSGSFEFNVGTAGSVTLIFQALAPILLYAPGRVRVTLVGGTDVPWSPPIDYVRHVMLPHLKRMGYVVEASLIRRGHYPRGGGKVVFEVPEPPGELEPLTLTTRGENIELVEGVSHCVRLPSHVARRQTEAARRRLVEGGVKAPIRIELEHYEGRDDPHLGPGSGIVVWAKAGEALIGGDALGARGKRAEEVGREAASKLLKDLSTGMALDTHMSDNILVYLALARGKSVIGGARLSRHAETVLWVIKHFLKVQMLLNGFLEKPFTLEVWGAGITR